MSSIKVLDLFSGIGGFAHGFETAGDFKTVAFCEIDPHAKKVLNKNFPDTPIIDDVRKIKGEDFKEVEVICGGFPCQDISVAGKQRGINEQTRSGLWIEYKRIIQEIGPRWVIIENVRNLLSNGLAIVLQDLHEIGYDAEWEIISARSIGSCHLRERVWIVAYPRCRFGRASDKGDSEKFRGRETLNQEVGSQNTLEIERSSIGRQTDSGELGSIESSNSGSFGLIQCQGQSEEIQSRGDKRLQREKSKQPSLPESLHSFNEIQSADSPCKRVQGLRASGFQESHSHGEEAVSLCSSEIKSNSVSDSDYFRFWPAFTSEEEKCEWWATSTSCFSDWWKVESSVCRVDDGLSNGLDKGRAQRIKQLGNSIVPQIARIIGSRILYHEALKEL